MSPDSGSSHQTSQVTNGAAARDTPLGQPIDVVSRTRFSGIVYYACMSFDRHWRGRSTCLASSASLPHLHPPVLTLAVGFSPHTNSRCTGCFVLHTNGLPPSLDTETV